MADDTRDPSEPVEHFAGPAVGPNPEGLNQQAVAAHEETTKNRDEDPPNGGAVARRVAARKAAGKTAPKRGSRKPKAEG